MRRRVPPPVCRCRNHRFRSCRRRHLGLRFSLPMCALWKTLWSSRGLEARAHPIQKINPGARTSNCQTCGPDYQQPGPRKLNSKMTFATTSKAKHCGRPSCPRPNHFGQMADKERTTVKIIVLGCANVGKTSLMRRYCNDTFTPVRKPTVGSDFSSKKIELAGQVLQKSILTCACHILKPLSTTVYSSTNLGHCWPRKVPPR